MPSTQRKVGAIVVLDGEKEYKAAIENIGAGNRVLSSEMRKLQAEYKGNAESLEFLTKKGDILDRQLLSQKDKVTALRGAVENAAKKYGEADERTMKWVRQLNDAEAAQYNLEHAIEENNEAIDAQGSFWGKYGGTLEDVAGKLGIKIPDGAKKALSGMKGLSAGTVAAMGAAVAGVSALVKAVQQLHQMTLDVAADVDTMVTESLVTGIDTQTYQALQYAENLVDVSVSTMSSSLTKLMQSQKAARDGNEDLAKSFQNLNVEFMNSDGTLRDSYEVMMDLIDALGQMEAGTERNALASELLGKNVQELNPLFAAGSDALKEYGEQARAVGYILDEQQIKKLGEVDDAYQEVKLTIAALKKQMAADFAPASKEAMELFRDGVQKAAEMLQRSGIIENLGSIIRSLINIIRYVGDFVTSSPGFNRAVETIAATFKGLAVVMGTVADVFNILLTIINPTQWGKGNIKTALGWNRNKGEYSNMQRALGYDDTTGQWQDPETGLWQGNYGHNAGGTDNWRGGLTWVGETGPELVNLPRSSSIFSAQDSAGAIGGDTYNFNVNVNDLQDLQALILWVKSARVSARMAR